jgi:hypothetical protein
VKEGPLQISGSWLLPPGWLVISQRALWLPAVLLWAQLGYATTGVALYVKGFAVIAADGRVNEIGPKIALHSDECKIDVFNGMAGMVAGLAEEQDVGFDTSKILRGAMEQSSSVSEAANTAERRIQHALPAALRDFQRGNPNQFQERANGSLQILMVGMDSAGEVQVARRSIPYDESRPAQREDTTGSDDRVGIAPIGETGAIDKELDRLHNTDGWSGKGDPTDLEKMAQRFIALEIVDKPLKVGPPVSMVAVDGSGIHWVEAGACHP